MEASTAIGAELLARGMRLFVGDRFALEVPGDWKDLSAYSLSGPNVRGGSPAATVVVQDDAPFGTPADQIENHIVAAAGSGVGWQIGRRWTLTSGDGLALEAAELYWQPAGATQRSFQRVFATRSGTRAYTIVFGFTEAARRRLSRTIDSIAGSLSPRSPGELPEPDAETGGQGDHLLYADTFSLRLPSGWTNTSRYMLSAPTGSSPRGSLVVELEELAAPVELETRARNEIAYLQATVQDSTCTELEQLSTDGGETVWWSRVRRPSPSGNPILQGLCFASSQDRLLVLCVSLSEASEDLLAGFVEMLMGSLKFW